MIDPDNIYHVLPIDDVEEHVNKFTFPAIGEPYCDCPCEPEHRKIEPDGLIAIHNSFDGREGIEWTRQLLKQDLPPVDRWGIQYDQN